MKTPNLSLGVVIFSLISSLSLPVALAGMHPGTNPPPGAVWMRAEAAPAAPLRTRAPEAARANALAASSNTLSGSILEPRLKPVPGGARAEFGLHKVFFPTDVNGNRPVTVTAPDGRTLAFRARLLAAHDASTGERWLLGQVRNRVGLIATASTVLYTNAFDSVRADLRYRCTPHGLEQDVILRQRLTLPNGVEPENVRLEVWTEWLDSPPAGRVAQRVDLRAGSGVTNPAPVLADDEQLSFVSMKIGAGHAFSLGAPGERVPVAKQFARVQQRDWLIETVDYSALRARLDGLGAAGPLRRGPAAASPEQLLATLAPGAVPASGQALSAMAHGELDPAPGVVLDFAIVCCVPVPPGAISWWPAGGNAHDALGGNPGTLLNHASYPGGYVGQGFYFNGYDGNLDDGDSVRIANAPNLNPAQGLTIDAWVYFTADMAGQNLPLVSKDGWSGRQYLLTKTWGDTLRAHVGITNGVFYYTDGQTVLQPDTWYHVAMTYSAAQSNLALYVNGALDTNVLVQGSLLATAEPLYLGGAPPWQYWWQGGLDEVDLFDRALSAAEIKTIYDAGAAGKISPQCVPPPADLAVWFPGDGHPYDVRGTNVAALQNGAGYAPAVASSGFRLDGQNDAVVAADDPALNFAAGQDFSLELWLQAAATGFNYDYGVQTLVSKRQTTGLSTARGWELFLVSGQPGLQLADAAGWANYLAAGTDLRDGGWHHLAVTVDRDDPEGGALYVDGVEVMTFDPTGVAGSLTNAAPLRLGVHPDSGLFCYFGGGLDEVSVYRRALSGSEISQLYEAGAAGKCKVDSDGDGLPDWWMMRYFGHATASASDLTQATDDYDGDGVNNLAEFLAGTDPNTIGFLLGVTNACVSASQVPVGIEVERGTPSSLALLIDSTNFAGASWGSFTTNCTVNLGTVEGWHDVWVGLRGRPEDAQPTWQWLRLKLDATPPWLAITHPVLLAGATCATGSIPMIQLQGYCAEPLASLSYDLTNAAGTFTNQPGFGLDQHYDTNTWTLTTNSFQVFDLELTNGLNTVTLHATDLAGNGTVTNFSFFLVSDATAPVLRLGWPQNNMSLCGDTFTLDGWVDDASATLTVTSLDATGATNQAAGLVERDGRFWVEDLPLADGSTALTLSATDAWGNCATTNFTVSRSALGLTVDTVDPTLLSQTTISVSGTVSDSSYSVQVNGVGATVNGPSWQADGVPVGRGGTATFEVVACPPGQGPPNAAAPRLKAAVDAPDRLYVGCGFQSWSQSSQTKWWGGFVDQATNRSDYSQVWQDGIESHAALATYYLGTSGASRCVTDYEWPADAWPSLSQGISFIPPGGDCAPAYPGLCDAACIGWDCCAVGDATPTAQVQAPSPANGWVGIDQSDTYGRAAQTFLVVRTGGKALPGRKSLFTLSGAAQEITARRAQPSQHQYAHVPDLGKRPVANPDVRIGNLGRLGADGRLYKMLPDGAVLDVTPTVPAKNFYTFQLSHTKHTLRVVANGYWLASDRVRPGAKYIVGQIMEFSQLFTPALPAGTTIAPIRWTLTGHYYNDGTNAVPGVSFPTCSSNYFVNLSLLTNESTTAWWVSGGFSPPHIYSATLGEGLTFANGQYAAVTGKGLFNMYRPIGTMTASTSSVALDNLYGWFELRYGFNSPGQFGIITSNTITMPPEYPGSADHSAQCVQKIYSTLRRLQTNDTSLAWYRLQASEVLDNAYPYAPPWLFGNCAEDSPGENLSNQMAASISDNFGIWLEFQPPGGQWVPLTVLNWNWGGEGAQVGGIWSLSNPHNTVNPTGSDTDVYPVWTNNIRHFEYVRE